MPEMRRCPRCGSVIPPDAAEGACPKCLMQLGIEAARGSAAGPNRTAPVSPRFTAPDPKELSRRFPQLEFIELLGQGGMGAVYKARQPALDRLVAVKILPPEVAEDPDFTERFTREARALARLSHPNIVAVHDFGRVEGQFYFVMEYVDGLNLRQMLMQGALKPQEALAIVPQICEALQFAHDEGLVHRDIKPENILLDRKGRVKVADFGLAKLLGKTPSGINLTGPGHVMGTPQYMSPEQLEHPLEVDHRADIYSLGVVFYEMLTGELPIGRFPPPSRKVEVDVRLDEIVLRALEKEPRRRYQRAGEVKTDVESVTRSGRPAGAAPPASEREPGSGRGADEAARRQVRWPAIALLATGVLNWIGNIIALIVFGLMGYLETPAPRPPLELFALLAMLLSGVILFGGFKMMRLSRYRFAVLAAILALIVTPGNIVGLPAGIWALVVLSSPEVKSAFAGRRDRAVDLRV